MSKRRNQQASPQLAEEALKVAKANQRPGQTKEQTKLIAQGIQKGIEQYKKQHSAKARELDKRLKKVRNQQNSNDDEHDVEVVTVYKQSKLSWILLALSWIAFAVYYFGGL